MYLEGYILHSSSSLFVDTVNFPPISSFPADICLLKVSNRNTRTSCEICSKLTIKTPEVFLLLAWFWCLYC